MSEHPPSQPERNPSDHPEKPDHAAVMQACTVFIIKHGLSNTYPPSSMWAPDYIDAVHFVNLPTAPPETPGSQTTGYRQLVGDIVSRLAPDERERVLLQAYKYNSNPEADRAQQVQVVDKAKGMLLVEHELETIAGRFNKL